MSRDASPFQTFGEDLRAARQAQHRSIDEIAQRTRINRRYIEAIESGDLSQLPSGPYTQAFLREYARAVGCAVPAELAGFANSVQTSSNVSLRPLTGGRERVQAPAEKPAKATAPARAVQPASTKLPPVTRDDSGKALGAAAVEQLGNAFRATKELPKIANQAAKTAARSAVRTTETVIKRVETGAKDMADAITSKSLWEEAEQVRRERRGLPPIPESESTTVRVSNDAAFDVRDIRETVIEKNVAPIRSTSPSQHAVVSLPSPFQLPIETDSIVADANERDEIPSANAKHPTTGIFSPTNIVIACVVLLFAGVLAFVLHLNKQDKRTSDAAQTTDVVKETPVKPKNADLKPVTPATKPKVDSLRFILKATDAVWVSIISDKNEPFKGELKAGETKSFAATDRFIVNLGNQRALEMTFNGQALSHLPTISNSGVVVRDLVLTRDHVTLGGESVSLNGSSPATSTTPSSATTTVAPASKTPKILVTPTQTPTVKKPTDATNPTSSKAKPKPTKSSSKRAVKNKIPPIEPLPARP
jgi:cytoskeletal protein RodZ